MVAYRLSLHATQLPDNLKDIRIGIEESVPVGFNQHSQVSASAGQRMNFLQSSLNTILAKHPTIGKSKNQGKVFTNTAHQLGTLGGGNHFIELCIDENQAVWVMIHSGSRGIGNKIGNYFITKAKEDMERMFISLPDKDLAYLSEGSLLFQDYIDAVSWAQDYAAQNRLAMVELTMKALRKYLPGFTVTQEAINCFAGETRVLTKKGVYPIRELAGTNCELLTSDGEWVDAPVKAFGKQELLKITLSRSGVIKTIRATATHKWFLQNVQRKPSEVTTTQLKVGDRLAASFPNPIIEDMPSEAIARGFVYGDGSAAHGKSYANFCGDKPKDLLPFFSEYGPVYTYKDVKRVTKLPLSWKKEYPSLDSDPGYLRGWLAGYFAADGDVGATGRPTLTSSSREDLEFVRNLCTTIGIGTFGIRERTSCTGYRNEAWTLYLVGLMRGDLGDDFFIRENHLANFRAGKSAAERRRWNVVKVESTGEVEEVFCAIVEGTHSFTLEDNILTSNCHHNYVERENHYGSNVFVTRKGAVRARDGDLGIIPGSMGTRSYIVRGKGNPESFCSCSHGAGRVLSRGKAKDLITEEQHVLDTQGVECRKDRGVIDESPRAYKDIDAVMESQKDLVDIVHTLKQVVCIKG